MKAWLKGGIIGVSAWFLLVVFLLFYCTKGHSASLGCNVFVLISRNLFLLFLGFSSLVLFFIIGGSMAEILRNVKETPQEKIIVTMTLGIGRRWRRVRQRFPKKK